MVNRLYTRVGIQIHILKKPKGKFFMINFIIEFIEFT